MAATCAALTLSLTACDGSDKPASGPQINGVAAIGAPISDGAVTFKCASGTNGSATTASDGRFSVSLADSDFPCALSVTGGSAGGKRQSAPLHSVAPAAGTANITSLTDLMVASAAAEDPATWFARATKDDVGAAFTADRMAQALEKLKTTLMALPGRLALPADFHPVTTQFTAQPGDAADDLLEHYGRALTTTQSTHAEACSQIAGDEKSTRTVYAANAFTVPGWTSFPLGLRTRAEGGEALVIPDPHLGKKTVAILERDAEGNITKVDSDGPFTSVLSLMGNRIGMLSGRNSFFKSTVSQADASSAHYVYLSDEFKEVDHRELHGSRFAVYVEGKYITDVEMGTDDKLRIVAAPTDAMDVAQWFTVDGVKEGEREDAFMLRAKAYKHTVDGKPTYVVVTVKAMDPDVPEALPVNQSVSMAVSR